MLSGEITIRQVYVTHQKHFFFFQIKIYTLWDTYAKVEWWMDLNDTQGHNDGLT